MAWYNKYRPQKFDDVLGQSLVKSVLQNAIAKNRVKHAYLFSGPKGVGKTTLARIFALELNNVSQNPESTIDIIELDAASHTGVDDIRQLIESAKTPPMLGQFKIFIIDEVHMLSKSAMNALLKILEEPPEYLVFLLATTNAEKLIPTVLSRLTVLHLSNHTTSDIVSRLHFIALEEGININQEALKLVAIHSAGSQRDATNLLETIASYELDFYDEKNTAELLGLLPSELLERTAKNLLSKENFDLALLETVGNKGLDGQGFLSQLLEFLLDRSLDNQLEYDDLIIPLAEVIHLQLPLSGVLPALALVKVRLQEVGEVKLVKKKSEPGLIRSNITPIVQEEPRIYSSSFIEKKNQASSESQEIEEIVQESSFVQQVLSSKTPSANISSHEDLNSYFQELIGQQGAPASLRMVQRDLSVKLEGEKLILQNSNTIFLSALKPSLIQNWLVDQFHLKFGFKPKIILELRGKQTEESVIPKISTISETTTILKNETISNISDHVESSNLNNEIFYTVYRSLPVNMENMGVNVRQGPLPEPENSQSNWDDDAKELFEFE